LQQRFSTPLKNSLPVRGMDAPLANKIRMCLIGRAEAGLYGPASANG